MSKKFYSHIELPKLVKEYFDEAKIDCVNTPEKECITIGGETSNIHFSPFNRSYLEHAHEQYAFIPSELLKYDMAVKLFNKIMKNEGGLSIDVSFDEICRENHTFKLLGHENYAQFADLFAKYAQQREVIPFGCRNHLVFLGTYLEYLVEAQIINYPIEIDYGRTEHGLYAQIHFHAPKMDMQNIKEALNENDDLGLMPYKSSLNDSRKWVDLLDIQYVKHTQKMIFTSCWFFNRLENQFSALLINELIDRSHYVSSLKNSLKTKVGSSHGEFDLIKQKSKEDFPQDYTSLSIDVNPLLIRRAYRVVVKGFSEIDKEDFQKVRALLEEQDESITLSSKEEETLKELLVSEGAREKIEQEVDKVKGGIEIDEYVKKIISNLDESKESDIKQIVTGNSISEDENNTVIENVTQKITNKSWELTKGNILEKVRKKLNESKYSSHREVDKSLEEVFKEEMGVDDKLSHKIIEEIGSKTTEELVAQKNEDVNEVIKQRLKIEKIENQLSVRKTQVDKMKGIIASLKGEVGQLRRDLSSRDKKSSDIESFKNNRAVQNLKKKVDGIMDFNDGEKEDSCELDEGQVSELKDKRIEQLSNEIGSLKGLLDTEAIKNKSLESKEKKLLEQVEKLKGSIQESKNTKIEASKGQGSLSEIKRMKKLIENLRENSDKARAELADKKTKLHKSNLEAKTLTIKVQQLEKKIALLTKRMAS